MMRTLRKDISTYNEMQTLEEAQEESGWKSRARRRLPRAGVLADATLAVLAGTGVQVFADDGRDHVLRVARLPPPANRMVATRRGPAALLALRLGGARVSPLSASPPPPFCLHSGACCCSSSSWARSRATTPRAVQALTWQAVEACAGPHRDALPARRVPSSSRSTCCSRPRARAPRCRSRRSSRSCARGAARADGASAQRCFAIHQTGDRAFP